MASDATDRPFLGLPPRSPSVSAVSGKPEEVNTSFLLRLIEDKISDSRIPVRITEGYEFDPFSTINKIELYRASKFKTGNIDSQGNKKFFFNICNAPAGNVTKNIDLDTSDITIQAEDGNHVLQALLYREKLKQWMKVKQFGLFLNKIGENLPIYGQTVSKKEEKDLVRYVPLRDLHRDPSIIGLKNSTYVIEHHRLQPDVLKQMKEKGWFKEKVDATIATFFASGDKQINVYEFYGWSQYGNLATEFPTIFAADEARKDEYVKVRAYAGMNIPLPQRDAQESSTFSAVLHVMPWNEDWPYKDLNMLEIEGRSLGLGIFESLFDLQERKNEMVNQKARSMAISSKHIFQTRSQTIESNILTDVDDGQILTVSNEITPIATEERNLAAYAQEENNIRELARDLSNSQEILTGESLPGRTPYRLGAMLAQNASKLLEYIQEKFGLHLEEILNEWIIPQFEKEMDLDFIMEIEDPELLEKIVEGDINRRLNVMIKDYFFAYGDFPTAAEADAIRQTMKKEYTGKQFASVLKGYLKFPKRARVVITNEGINTRQQLESLGNLLQLLGQNPTAMENPQTKGIVMLMMERMGIPPTALGSAPPPQPQVTPGAMPSPNDLGNGAKEAGVNAAMAAQGLGMPTA